MSDTGNKARRFHRAESAGFLRLRGCNFQGKGRVGLLAAAEVHHFDFRVVQEFMAAALIAIPAEFEHIAAV